VDSCLIELDDYDEIVHYDAPTSITHLDLIAQLVPTVEGYAREWKLLHLLHQALRIHGLGSLGLLDVDPQEHLDRMLSNQVDVKELEKTMVELASQQIDRGGPTIGLDIKGVSQHIELARRVETIVAARKEELSRVTIIKNADGCDLRPLALTAYGFEILTALGMNLTTDKEGLSLIQEKVRELGCELKTTEEKESQDPVQISEGLKEYIENLVEYNARKQSM